MAIDLLFVVMYVIAIATLLMVSDAITDLKVRHLEERIMNIEWNEEMSGEQEDV